MFDLLWQPAGKTPSLREKSPTPTPTPPSIPPSPPADDPQLPWQQLRSHNTVAAGAQVSTLAAIVFMVLVLLGNTKNMPALTNIYFLKIDVSQVIPRSFPNAVLVNSIVQTLGLRGFYQVGLWNHCEGYKSDGVTDCGTPKAMYTFNPIELLLSQLLEGATIAIPSSISRPLAIAKTASHWMFACFFVSISFLAASLLLGWFGRVNRRNSVMIAIISFIAALFTTVAAVVSTVLYSVFRGVFESAPEFNIRANLGSRMYAFVWLASGFSLVAFAANLTMCFNWVLARKKRLQWASIFESLHRP